jgi:hypothetical protein
MRNVFAKTAAFTWALAGLLSGCAGDRGESETDGGIEPVCTTPTEVGCIDALITTLSLHDDKVSTGEVVNVAEGSDWVSTLDATAGGFGQSQNFPWLYVKFTPDGLKRVDIDDESAVTDMSWDLGAKRFILRLNGGSSGPSCVGAVPFLERAYADLTSVPEGLSFVQDDYVTPDCTIINDSSGLPDSPQVALGGWWEYPGCVKTTGVPFLIQLQDGSVVRFVVEQYYATGQETCNSSSTPGTGGGTLRIRWGFVSR